MPGPFSAPSGLNDSPPGCRAAGLITRSTICDCSLADPLSWRRRLPLGIAEICGVLWDAIPSPRCVCTNRKILAEPFG